MGNILQFSSPTPPKFGFEKVRKRTRSASGARDQLNLFGHAKASPGKVLRLTTDMSPFEEALRLDEKEDPRAAKAYRKSIDAGDCVADAYCNLGILESRAGNPPKAFDCFTNSLKHDPRHFESHYNLGNLYFEESNFRLARMHYEIAIELDPTFSNIYFNLGLVHALSDNLKAAVNSLGTYRKLAPADEARKADQLLASLKLSMTNLR